MRATAFLCREERIEKRKAESNGKTPRKREKKKEK
jgi:hypothetical protein